MGFIADNNGDSFSSVVFFIFWEIVTDRCGKDKNLVDIIIFSANFIAVFQMKEQTLSAGLIAFVACVSCYGLKLTAAAQIIEPSA